MRAITLAALVAAVFGVCDAFADLSSTYRYCLMTGPAQDCSYNTMAQCLASKRGMRTFASRIIGTAAIAEVPATRNKVKEQYCAARWREAGLISLQCL